MTAPLLALSDDEHGWIKHLLDQLNAYQGSNARKLAYYEGKQRVEALGFSIPPAMRHMTVAAGWPGTVVDVLEERLDWYGWNVTGEDDHGLVDLYGRNRLQVDSSLVHTHALVYGTAFAALGTNSSGDVVIQPRSPRTTTGAWNTLTHRLDAALTVTARDESKNPAAAVLYLPDGNAFVTRRGQWWTVEHREPHQLGQVLLVQFDNRRQESYAAGRSEITTAVQYYTDAACRTLLGMEVSREFYSSPQRYVLGADANTFTNADGTPKSAWEAIMGRVWGLGRDDEGELPQVGQFAQSSPSPYIDQVKTLAQLLAAEAAIPPSYLGFTTENPASADAISRSEARLVKRAERRQTTFGASWLDVGRLALLLRDGAIPDDYNTTVSARWRDASTPTRSAAADEASKLVGAGVLPSDSTVTWDRIGLTPDEQTQLAADHRRTAGRGVLQALRDRAGGQ